MECGNDCFATPHGFWPAPSACQYLGFIGPRGDERSVRASSAAIRRIRSSGGCALLCVVWLRDGPRCCTWRLNRRSQMRTGRSAPSLTRLLCLSPTLDRTPNVHRHQTQLQGDERRRATVEPPHHPHHIAQQKHPEAGVAFAFDCRGDQSRRDNGNDHRWPLNQVQDIHGNCRVNSTSPCSLWMADSRKFSRPQPAVVASLLGG